MRSLFWLAMLLPLLGWQEVGAMSQLDKNTPEYLMYQLVHAQSVQEETRIAKLIKSDASIAYSMEAIPISKENQISMSNIDESTLAKIDYILILIKKNQQQSYQWKPKAIENLYVMLRE